MDVDGFADYCESQVERQGGGMTESTASTYLPIVKRFDDWYDGVGEPDEQDVRDWVRHLEIDRQVSNATIQKYFNAIRKYFYCEGRLGEINQVSTWVGDQYPKGGSDTPPSFTDDELQALRDAASDDPRANAMVAILSTLGIRVTELVTLTTNDYTPIEDHDGGDDFPDWTAAVVTVTRAKRRETVVDEMPIGDYERDAIEDYLDARGEYAPRRAASSKWLFPTVHDDEVRHMSTDNARVIVTKVAERTDDISAGDVHPHKFRHTVGTRLGKQGYSAQQISKYLGQANSASAEEYVHLDRSDVAGMREEVDS